VGELVEDGEHLVVFVVRDMGDIFYSGEVEGRDGGITF